MPIPKPEARENQSKYISRCMSWASENEGDMAQEQQLAMCYEAYRTAKGSGITKDELMTELSFEQRRLERVITSAYTELDQDG